MKKKGILVIGILMLGVAIFMALSYHQLLTSGEADSLSRIAYYVWLGAIPVLVIGISLRIYMWVKKGNS